MRTYSERIEDLTKAIRWATYPEPDQSDIGRKLTLEVQLMYLESLVAEWKRDNL